MSSTMLAQQGRAAAGEEPAGKQMSWRNRLGLYGSYFLGMAGIGFTLPYLPIYLEERGLSPRGIGLLSTLAAFASLVQFPIALWSDRVGRRKPFLIVLLAVLAAATFLLRDALALVWLSILFVLFAENGVCRATVESLAGAAVTRLAPPDRVGAALSALRFWRPVSIVVVALGGGLLAEWYGIDSILLPLFAVQALAVAAAFLIREKNGASSRSTTSEPSGSTAAGLRDGTLWVFVAAMVLFHVANSPGGVYLGLFLKNDLHAEKRTLSHAFVVSMVAWMLVVRFAGPLTDRLGRKPMLLAGWLSMTIRLVLVALAMAPWQVLAIQVLDGAAQGFFAVAAAAWVTDRLADPRRVGEAQALVGTALVFGSAVGPALSGLVVDQLGYRGMFGLLAGIGAFATGMILTLVPETMPTSSQTRLP